MPKERTPGKPTTRRYSEVEKAQAVRLVRQLRAEHGIEHYLDLVAAGRIDLTEMLTHTFGLSQWRDAFLTIADQEETAAIKVAIDPHR